MKKHLLFAACLLLLTSISCGDDDPADGDEGGSCYPNLTCNSGFMCVSGICVRIPDGLGVMDRGTYDWPWLPDMYTGDGAPDAGVTDLGPDGPTVDGFVLQPDAPVIPDGVTGLPTCGDGVVNQTSEQCDGNDLNNRHCYNLSFDFGSLSCRSDCTFDTSLCMLYSFKALSKGSFTMGSHHTEACRDKADEDQHTVTLTSGFRIATTPVSQTQFQSVMGYNPSSSATCGSDCPVDSVTWHEAAAYANALSTAGSLTTCYSCAGSGPFAVCSIKSAYLGANIYSCPGYRLPTEAEWEYAYRAGTYTPYYNGLNSLTTCTTCTPTETNASQIAWYCNNSMASTQPVGRKLVNKWGLYDMAGNVAEWAHDYYQASLGTTAATNPAGPTTGTYRVRRGMTSDRMPHGLRAAERDSAAPGYPGLAFSGFRPVQTISPTPPTCGNGSLNAGEQCDGSNLNNQTCVTQGYSGGTLACDAGCRFNYASCTGAKLCGNGKIDTSAGEQCDGSNVSYFTCIGLGYKGGTLACDKTCKFDVSSCTLVSFCGDGKIDGQEVCDGSNLNSKTCKDLGYATGTLTCDSKCAFSTSACSGTSTYCGNAKIDTGEQCDGSNIGLFTCIGLGYKSGTLACSKLCRFDVTNCTPLSFCGDGKVEGQEACDGSNLNNKTCVTQGFASGALTCTSCKLVTTGCSGTASTCGNGTVESTEQCDGTNLAGVTCANLGLVGGTLACSATCQRVTTGCTGIVNLCGNGVINSGEQCDGTNLAGTTCTNLGLGTGTLTCSPTCQRVTTGCSATTLCGNSVINSGEQCDGTNLAGATCSILGLGTGTVTCSATCQRVTTGCSGATTLCGNSVINSGEQCDGTNLAGATCSALGLGTGTVTCSATCQRVTTGCSATTLCGNSVINSGEQCDGTNLAGATCSILGLGTGTVTCSATCQRVTTGCSGATTLCGNSVINTGEQCDGTNLAGATCANLGLGTGTVTCSATCQRVTTGCTSTALCGNSVINTGEQCDGTNLAGASCSTLGLGTGTLTCSATCQRVTTGCSGTTSLCNDGLITGNEQCDGTNLGGYTCAQLSGFSGGTLACSATTCMFDTSSCTAGSGSTPSFVNIQAGSFNMGSPSNEPCRQLDGYQENAHQVTLSNAFRMMTTEVTQASFQAVMGYNYSFNKSCGTTCPVDTVSWHEAAAYANAMSVAGSLTPCYTCSGSGTTITCTVATAYSGSSIYTCPGYRLPTEAEWEYAYRAGTTTAYYNGANSSTYCSNCSTAETNAAAIAWYCANASRSYNWLLTRPVGGRTANAWGLYDMAGNIQEWVHDGMQNSLGTAAATNPVVNPNGTFHVLRGSRVPYAWAYGLRAAYRYASGPLNKNQGIGFRVVRRGSGTTSLCGNGAINSGEQCDGTAFGSATCTSLGLGTGTLSCSTTCQRITTGCTGATATCGNGVINSGEQCDGTLFGGITCATLGLGTGTLSCSATCQRITTGCSSSVTFPQCGNGTIEYGERCEVGNLGGQSCTGLGYSGGTLGCWFCNWDTSSCTGTSLCGNGTINSGEQCDGSALGGSTCQSLGLGTGTLACDSYTCQRDTRGCYNASGGTWSAMLSNTGNTLNGVWGTSASNIYAVGNGGTMRRFNGSSWTTVNSGSTAQLNAVWGTSASNIYFVGNGGTVLRYNGTAFTSVYIGAASTHNCDSVWGTSASNIFVGCHNLIYRFNGVQWTSTPLHSFAAFGPTIAQIWGSGPSNVYAINDDGSSGGCLGSLFRFNGTTWTDITSIVGCPSGVWGASASNVHVMSYYRPSKYTNTSLTYDVRYNGSTWTYATLPSNLAGQRKLHGTAANLIISLGPYTALPARYNGSSWLPMTPNLSGTQRLYDVWGYGKTFYAVGTGGIIRRYIAP